MQWSSETLKNKDMKTQLIEQLVKEYKANPNCWPDLWIQGEGLNREEEKHFINLCLEN
jgi:hypothetical protein